MKLMDSLKVVLKSYLGPHYWLLILLLLIGLCVRLPGATDWPMPFHPMLQYENALDIKYMVLDRKRGEQTELDKQWMAGFASRMKGISFFAPLVNSESDPWLGGVWNTVSWVLGAIILHTVAAKTICSPFGALVAVGFYLFHPFAIVVSRSLQHEAGMLFGMLLAWLCLLIKDPMRSWVNAILVGITAGILLLLKAGVALIPLSAVYLGYCVTRHGWRGTLLSPQFYVIALLLFLPSYLWVKYILGMNETHQLKWFLLLDSNWYITTWQHMAKVIGIVPMLVFVGVSVWKVVQRDWFWICAFAGCVAYVFFFNYACMTHDYYLLPLFPMIALAWGKLAQWLIYRCKHLTPQPGEAGTREHGFWQYRRLLPNLVSIMLIAITSTFGSISVSMLTSGPYRPLETTCKQLGDQLGIGTKVIALTNDYAMSLRYFSGLHAEWWPTAGDLWYEGLAGGR